MPRIFLSPSTQEYNLYVDGSNEEQVMNQLADAMEPYLRTNGIRFVRNSPDGNVTQSIAQSNSDRFDLHIALHSNASPENMSGQLQGTDIYFRPGSAQSRRFANILVHNFRQIYPYPWMVDALPSTSLAEVRRTVAPAVLIETAYHDNPEDAAWIRNNLDAIARAIVLSLTEYFGIPFLNPQSQRTGRVNTGGGYLMLRSRPNTGAPIIARIPNGAAVTVYGITPSYWFVTGYGPNVGYSSGDYITLQD